MEIAHQNQKRHSVEFQLTMAAVGGMASDSEEVQSESEDFQSMTDSEAPAWTRSSTSSISDDPIAEFQQQN